MYRKVPIDLLEGSKQGSVISWLALFCIATLVFLETKAFFTNEIQTDLALDTNTDKFLRVNFNVTMMDLPCDYATVNVMSVFSGKEHAHLNITQHVAKFSVDENQVRQQYMSRNMQQNDIALSDTSVTETVEEMVQKKQREDAVLLDPKDFQQAVQDHMFVFVDMFASWCSHCQVLAPTWEKLAEVMYDATMDRVSSTHPDHAQYTKEEFDAALLINMPVLIAKVDCVEHHSFCMEQGIMGYPTLRLFVNGKKETDYHGDRSILAMTQFLKFVEERHRDEYERKMGHTDAVLDKMNLTEEDRKAATQVEVERHEQRAKWNPQEHPGCQLSGYLMMDRAPGHFYIQAQSKSHDLAPAMTNLSHTINHLSFGDEKAMGYVTGLIKREKGIVFPENFHRSIKPMDGNVYVTQDLHEAYHHYIKLVATNVLSYRVVPSTQLAKYRTDAVPEAKFVLDLSPISVTYRAKTRRWYDYVTSIMAIVGGVFTVTGMIEAVMRRGANLVRHQKKGPHRHAY
jgi:thiol-disulfide isomerase/thioredoxin